MPLTDFTNGSSTNSGNAKRLKKPPAHTGWYWDWNGRIVIPKEKPEQREGL